MLNRFALTSSCIAWLAASAALAQPSSPPAAAEASPVAVSPLTVQAAPTPTVIDRQAHTFVKSAAATNHNIDQIGRWEDAICVQVTGLIPGQAAVIKARIESVAQAVGLHAPHPHCKANVRIMFANRPQPLSQPIEPFYIPRYGSNPLTRRYIPTMRFAAVFMMADSKALEGKDLGQVADYMAMLTLSEPESLDGCNSISSVIDLYAKPSCTGRDAPDGLTSADAAFLTALYEQNLDIERNFEEGDIAHRMAQILIKANTAARAGAESSSAPPADAKAR